MNLFFDKVKIFLQYYIPWLRDEIFYERAVNENHFFTEHQNRKMHKKIARVEYEIYTNAPWLNTESISGNISHTLKNPEKTIKYNEYTNTVIMQRQQYAIIFLTFVLIIVTTLNVYFSIYFGK